MTSGEELKQRNGLDAFALDLRLTNVDYHAPPAAMLL